MKKTLLIALLIFSIISKAADIEINLQHYVGTQELSVPTLMQVINNGDSVHIETLKYYVGNFKLTYKNGQIYDIKNQYFLIDSDQPASTKITLKNIPEGELDQIQFGVGVDSVSNELGLTDGALDPMNGMYWAWNSGFINFKIEGQYLHNGSLQEFKYHIGGFLAPNQTYQTVNMNTNQIIDNGENHFEIEINLTPFFKKTALLKSPLVLSPSKKAKKIAILISSLFLLKI